MQFAKLKNERKAKVALVVVVVVGATMVVVFSGLRCLCLPHHTCTHCTEENECNEMKNFYNTIEYNVMWCSLFFVLPLNFATDGQQLFGFFKAGERKGEKGYLDIDNYLDLSIYFKSQGIKKNLRREKSLVHHVDI